MNRLLIIATLIFLNSCRSEQDDIFLLQKEYPNAKIYSIGDKINYLLIDSTSVYHIQVYDADKPKNKIKVTPLNN